MLILTARGEEADRVLGLEVGADDYLAKPFSPRELILRLRKLIEGRGADAQLPLVRFGILEVDESRFRVKVGEDPIEISATEMRLLTELLHNRGKVLSRDRLLQKAWGFMPNVTQRTIDTHVKRLRQKLGILPVYKMIDTCASEFDSYVPYFYSTYEEENESVVSDRKKIVVLGHTPIMVLMAYRIM